MTIKELYDLAIKNDFADYKILWKGGFLQTITSIYVSHADKIIYVW